MAAMFVNGSGRNEQTLQKTAHRCFQPSFGSFGQVVSEEKIFLKIGQSETRIACGGHVCQWIGTNQVSVHLGKRFQRRRFFRNQPIRNKNSLWRPCLLTDRDEMSNRYRGPSIDASCQVSDHLAKRFQGEDFQKSTNQKQELPVAAMFANGSG